MKKFHKAVSFVFQPLLMPTYGIIVFLFTDLANFFMPVWKWFAIGGTFLFTALLPAMPILLMLKNGQIKDLYISKKEQRTFPYMFSIIAYVFWTIFLWRILHLPHFFVAMGIGSILSIIIITIINLKWKISAHLSGVGGLTGGVFAYSFIMGVNPVFAMIAMLFISALTAFSRIELKAHTPGQTLAGFTVGFLTVFIAGILVSEQIIKFPEIG
jgi:membrane-associated phospholipid phosphatase